MSSNLVANALDFTQDIGYLDVLFDEKKLLKVVEASFYSKIPQQHLSLFCHKYGLYCLPTIELAQWLKEQIDDTTIEIGSGNGALARYLGVPATDSKFMELPEIKMYYYALGQPTTKYADDVVKLDAVAAIKKYKPKTVFGCWVTHKFRQDEQERGGNMYGIDEDWVLQNVNKYIVIGNEQTHGKKRILRHTHKELKFHWLYSRSLEYSKNVIYVWECINHK